MRMVFFVVQKEGKYGIIGKDGTMIHELTIPVKPRIRHYYPGLLRINYSNSTDHKTIYVDHFGRRVAL